MITSMEECRALLNATRGRGASLLKRFEMSSETLRQIEANLSPLVPVSHEVATLWGVPLSINEAIADGEIRPIYETHRHV